MKTLYKALALGTLSAFTLASCETKKATENGLEYEIIEAGKSEKSPVIGDYVTINITIKNDKDSVLYSSASQGTPPTITLNKPAYEGEFTEGLFELHEGDSAVFMVDTELMRKASGRTAPQAGEPTGILKYHVRLVKVLSAVEFESRQKEAQEKDLRSFADNNKVGFTEKESGIWIHKSKENPSGLTIKEGDSISVHYTGMFADGAMFDSSEPSGEGSGKPFGIIVGKGQVIKGWDKGLQYFSEGDEGYLYLLSALAYGPMGAPPVIPPNTPLIFKIKIVKNHGAK